jgi:nucleoside-diphosphate-sugar epimerase
MKRILVTGGSGFIGRHIISALGSSHTVFAPTHKELDVTDSRKFGSYIRSHRIGTIIHAAVGETFGGFEDSIRMFVSVMEQAENVHRIIYFGSGAEYAKQRDLVRVKETDFGTVVPRDEYGLSKYLVCLMAATRINITTFRLFGVYGPGEDYRNRFISNSIVKQLLGIPIVIKQDVIFDYLFIDDLMKIVKYAVTHPMKNRVYNVTPDTSISLVEIVNIIKRIGQVNTPVRISLAGRNYEYSGDNSRLRRELPGFRFRTYEEGIRSLYAYYKERVHTLDTQAVRKDDFFTRSVVRNP